MNLKLHQIRNRIQAAVKKGAVGSLQVVSIIAASLCVVVSFVQWRRASAHREEYCAQQQERFMLLQTRCIELSDAQKLHLSSEIERLRTYVEEVRAYREMRDRARDQRLENLELVVRTMRRVQP